MDRIPQSTPGATADRRFQEGNPGLGVLGTLVPATWANQLTDEQLAIILAAGLTPNPLIANQVLQAIQILTGQDVSTHSLAIAAGLALARVDYGRAGEGRGAVTLLRQSGSWPAGITPTAPSGSNTFLPNEYFTGVYPGVAWPYVTIGPLDFATGAGGGFYPACVDDSGVNYYRNGGFLLEGGSLLNGSRLEISLAGLISTTVTNRIVEIIVEPDFDPNAAFDATKAFAFQAGAFSSSGGTSVGFHAKIEILCLGYDRGSDFWLFESTFTFLAGDSSTSAPQSFSRSLSLEISGSDVDFSKDQTFVIRFKTDLTGATVGNEGNGSGSNQTGSEIAFTVQLAHVVFFPGEAA